MATPKLYHQCSDCGTTDPQRLYASRKMPRCHDCQHYFNLTTKATGGGVTFTREQFLAWREEEGHRACKYCRITSAELTKLAIVNVRTKRPFEVIGVDRRDNTQPYALDNLVPCCAPCNGIKSGLLTEAEMDTLGPVLAGIWKARLDKLAA